jgi:hypothetical protein
MTTTREESRMAQFDKADARRHQERVERARGNYGDWAIWLMDCEREKFDPLTGDKQEEE